MLNIKHLIKKSIMGNKASGESYIAFLKRGGQLSAIM